LAPGTYVIELLSEEKSEHIKIVVR
jgi:hypothetical protein